MTDAEITCPHPDGGTVTTLVEAFERTAALQPDAVALRTPGDHLAITWRDYAARVHALTAGLAALGVRRGDTVGIMLTNRPEFNLVDAAAIHLGAVPFSIYNTSSPDQIAYLFSHAENTVVITEKAFLPGIEASGARLQHIICVDGPADGALTLEDVEAAGSPDFDLQAARAAITASDIVTLIYTSGTTGPPKGVELTHRNIIAQLGCLAPLLGIGPDDATASYLPHAHLADRTASHYASIIHGQQLTLVADPRTITAVLPDIRPTIWFAVPRIWQKIKSGTETALAADPNPITRNLNLWGLNVGRRAAEYTLAGTRPPAPLVAQHAVANQLVLAKLRRRLGLDRCRWGISGAAPIPADTLAFFFGLGIPIYEVWGMSETTATVTSNAPGAIKIGSVGKVVPPSQLALAADGELLYRGPQMMRGYRKDPYKTAEAIDTDGWLHTGDIGEIDENGFVTIVDRKKELIINAAGKNMSPSNIENAMKAASSLIAQVVAIGDAQPYNTALIILDPDVVAARKDALGLTDPSSAAAAVSPVVRALITDAIREGNSTLSRVEQVKRFRILPRPWDPGGDEITPTMKLKRRPIAEKYEAEIESLYEATPGPEVVDLGS
ncbi:AMP-dependent synthetase/ligase [Gordonia liuliyuniae]|uniref:Acyl-CoA synthetase n=1 Tax=Gordonia liuliyuniae TaxID=2911517 RepID=A0ABS9IWB5_9ACTN|nr:long-chain fatty acid--CoA ligase [Gordonia liuliyuniae]MCF8589854.1 long-chain fatty acid--CoA ligase [Gordonia liuliyuniae]